MVQNHARSKRRVKKGTHNDRSRSRDPSRRGQSPSKAGGNAGRSCPIERDGHTPGRDLRGRSRSPSLPSTRLHLDRASCTSCWRRRSAVNAWKQAKAERVSANVPSFHSRRLYALVSQLARIACVTSAARTIGAAGLTRRVAHGALTSARLVLPLALRALPLHARRQSMVRRELQPKE